MAFTTFLMTVSVMVAIASAGFPGWPDDDNPFPGFRSPMFDFDDLKIKPSNPNLFKNYNFKKNDGFNNFGFRHQFPTIDPKKIETYKPGEGETFTGKSIRTRTSYTNVNGKVNEEGSETRIENDNGRVNKEKVVYKSDGTQS